MRKGASVANALMVVVEDTRKITFPIQEAQKASEIIAAVADRVREAEDEGYIFRGMAPGSVTLTRTLHPPTPEGDDPFGDRILAAKAAQNGEFVALKAEG